VMREMDNLAARWIHLHRAFRSRLKATELAANPGFCPAPSRPLVWAPIPGASPSQA
jgi:hypothetical protein